MEGKELRCWGEAMTGLMRSFLSSVSGADVWSQPESISKTGTPLRRLGHWLI